MNSENVIIDMFIKLDLDSKIKIQNIINSIVVKEKPEETSNFEYNIKNEDLCSICWF